MLFWAVDNPPPANYLLISGDRDFSNALHQLRMRRYNILLAQPTNVSQALVAAAKSVWLWTSLSIGGPPLPEIPHLRSASSGNRSTGETPCSSAPDSTQPADSNQKNHNNGWADNRNKGKQSWRRQKHNVNIPRTTSKGSQEGQQPNGSFGASSSDRNGMKQPNHASTSTKSGSRTQESDHNNGRPGFPAPSNVVQGVMMGFILRALHELKTDKIAPTEHNIADCIHYGEINIPTFNVRMVLDYAIEHRVVLVHKLGNNLPLYVGKNDTLWRCSNIMDTHAKHPKAKFDAVLKFVSSTDGRTAILSSKCRYHAISTHWLSYYPFCCYLLLKLPTIWI